jgi:hypothetical protein
MRGGQLDRSRWIRMVDELTVCLVDQHQYPPWHLRQELDLLLVAKPTASRRVGRTDQHHRGGRTERRAAVQIGRAVDRA